MRTPLYFFRVIGVLVIALGVTRTSITQAAAATAIISTSPSSNSLVVGTPFRINVLLNTGGQAVSAVKVNLTFSGSLTYNSTDTSSSIFSTSVSAPSQSGSTISLSMTRFDSGYTGNGGLIAAISFTATSAGSATFSIVKEQSEAIAYSDSSDILSSVAGGNYTVNAPVSATPTPAPTATPATASSTPSPTPAPTPKATPTPVHTAKPTSVPTPKTTPPVVALVSPSPIPSTTPTPSPTATPALIAKTTVPTITPLITTPPDSSTNLETQPLSANKISRSFSGILPEALGLIFLGLLAIVGIKKIKPRTQPEITPQPLPEQSMYTSAPAEVPPSSSPPPFMPVPQENPASIPQPQGEAIVGDIPAPTPFMPLPTAPPLPQENPASIPQPLGEQSMYTSAPAEVPPASSPPPFMPLPTTPPLPPENPTNISQPQVDAIAGDIPPPTPSPTLNEEVPKI